MTWKKYEIEEAKERLREILKPGDKVFIIIRSVAKSGMSRKMDVYKFDTEPEFGISARYLTRLVAKATDHSSGDDGLRIPGTGMDMCYHLTECLSRALFNKPDQLKYQLL